MKTEESKIIWHENHKNLPKEDGWYLCKCVDLVAPSNVYDFDKLEDIKWKMTEPYYLVVNLVNGYWDCDGVVVAWAKVPVCNISLD